MLLLGSNKSNINQIRLGLRNPRKKEIKAAAVGKNWRSKLKKDSPITLASDMMLQPQLQIGTVLSPGYKRPYNWSQNSGNGDYYSTAPNRNMKRSDGGKLVQGVNL